LNCWTGEFSRNALVDSPIPVRETPLCCSGNHACLDHGIRDGLCNRLHQLSEMLLVERNIQTIPRREFIDYVRSSQRTYSHGYNTRSQVSWQVHSTRALEVMHGSLNQNSEMGKYRRFGSNWESHSGILAATAEAHSNRG